jgi:hypothetical protein
MESTMQFNCKSDDHSGQENEKPNQLRAVMTRSKDDKDNHNLWTSWKGGHRKGQLSKMQENDCDIALVLTSLRQQSRPTGSDLLLSSPVSRHFANLWDSLVLIDNIVYKKFVKRGLWFSVGNFTLCTYIFVSKFQRLPSFQTNKIHV